ncbi:MAG: nitroreductase family protein [Paludibacteraceae bacterium]|nr:nitroreductase family protein [Paludibacteraceae bacterium]
MKMNLADRRSIRRYTDQPVPQERLEELLSLAFRASNTGNMQTYSVIVTRDKERKRALAPLHFNQPCVLSASVVLTFCVDFRRFSDWCLASDAQPGYDNFLSFYGATIDSMLVAQAFASLAEQEGWGLCFLGTTNYNAAGICDALHLPQLVFPVTTVTLGWPDELPELSDRLPAQGLIHLESYQEGDVKALYAAKEALPQMRRFVEENGKRTLAQVFTDVRYPKESNEAFSDALLSAIQRQGFHL